MEKVKEREREREREMRPRSVCRLYREPVAGDKLRLVRGKTRARTISLAIEWLHLAPINKTFALEFDPIRKEFRGDVLFTSFLSSFYR